MDPFTERRLLQFIERADRVLFLLEGILIHHAESAEIEALTARLKRSADALRGAVTTAGPSPVPNHTTQT